MSSSPVCPHCSRPLPQPTAAGQPEVQCRECGAWVKFRNRKKWRDPSDQWYVTLPDGQQVGPLSAEQMMSATQRGVITADSLVRRADWAEAIPNATFLVQHQQNAPPGSSQIATYTSQFSRNPIGTFLFGPKMALYAGDRSAAARVVRKRLFRRWCYLLLAMIVAAVVLPFLGGLIGGGLEIGVGGALLGFVWFFWPALFFLLGMLMYSGALFEWTWFFQSKRLRETRAMFGDSTARKFYLVFGGVLMTVMAIFSLGSSVLIGGGMLLAKDDAKPAAVAATRTKSDAPQVQLAMLGRRVTQARQGLEETARPIRRQLDRLRQLKSEIEAHPDDLVLRDEYYRTEGSLSGLLAPYRRARYEWEMSVRTLESRARATQLSSKILEANRSLPPSIDFTNDIIPAPTDRFPVQNVRSTVAQLQRSRRMAEDALRRRDSGTESELQHWARQVEQLCSYLKEVERKWGFHSSELDGPSVADLAAQSAMAKPARNPDRMPAAPVTSQESAAPRESSSMGANTALLLRRFQVDQHAIHGRVEREDSSQGPRLVIEAMNENVLARLPSPALEDNYEFEADVTRLDGDGGLFFVLPLGDYHAALVIDGGDEIGPRTGLVALDNQVLRSPRYPAPVVGGRQLPRGETVHVTVAVNRNRVVLSRNRHPIYSWEGDLSRLSLPPFYRSEYRTNVHTGGFHARFAVENVVLRAR